MLETVDGEARHLINPLSVAFCTDKFCELIVSFDAGKEATELVIVAVFVDSYLILKMRS